MNDGAIERALVLEMVRVTETAALSASHHTGKGDKHAVDGAGTTAMREVLNAMPINGTVVIGEGEMDEAPMLFIGERLGLQTPSSYAVDIAVDPVARHQSCARFAHGVQTAQALLQTKRHVVGTRGIQLRLGQKQTGFEIGEPRRHHEIISGLLERDRVGAVQIVQILIDERKDRNLAEIDFLGSGERQKQVERPFPAAQIKRESVGVRQVRAIRRAWQSAPRCCQRLRPV